MGGTHDSIKVDFTTVDLYDNNRGWDPEADPRGSYAYLTDDTSMSVADWNDLHQHVKDRLVENLQAAVDSWYEHFGKHVLKAKPEVI